MIDKGAATPWKKPPEKLRNVVQFILMKGF